MKKILLPTDFSESSRHACEYALNLYQDDDVRFILINTYVMPVSTAEMLISINDVLSQSSEEGLEEEKNYLESTYPDLWNRIEVRSINGFLENVLLKIIQNENIDMIIMGTTGASGFKKFFFGSNAAKVLRHVNCPTLTVPLSAPIVKPANIVLALDGDHLPDLTVIEPLIDVTKRFQAKLEPLHVNTDPMQIESPANAMTNHIPAMHAFGNPMQNIKATTVLSGLQSFINSNKVDMLAMIHHKRSFIKELFHHSNTREMAMLGATPLMVLAEL